MIRLVHAAALAGLLAADDARTEAVSLEIRGSELVVSTEGGALARAQLIGAVLTAVNENGNAVKMRIDGIATDPARPEGDVVLYDLSIATADAAWVPACPIEADGGAHAVLQPGEDGALRIFCTAGALGKCIRRGYRPWAMQDGVALKPYWQACVRMVRADYCGNDQSTTLDGMQISIYDALGVNPRGEGLEFAFEAAWDANGAICVAHPRVPENVTLEELGSACPRLAGRLGAGCTAQAARRMGNPLLFNGSRGEGAWSGR